MATHARRAVHPPTTLDYDEQSELAAKVLYAIGLEQLVGDDDAALIRWERAPAPIRRGPRPQLRRELPHPPRADHRIRERAAALGLGAGRRGQWLGR
jgi:hypothetical protein